MRRRGLHKTVYICNERQGWFRDFVVTAGPAACGFVGSVATLDREAVSVFFTVDGHHVPLNPDLEQDPTAALVALARRSKHSSVRKAMVPEHGGTSPHYP